MKLYEILTPRSPNDGGEYPIGTHPDFRDRIAKLVGGYTIGDNLFGYWRDEKGEVYRERMLPVRVACEPEQMATIIADALATFADQKCVMSYVLSEDVTFTPQPMEDERVVSGVNGREEATSPERVVSGVNDMSGEN